MFRSTIAKNPSHLNKKIVHLKEIMYLPYTISLLCSLLEILLPLEERTCCRLGITRLTYYKPVGSKLGSCFGQNNMNAGTCTVSIVVVVEALFSFVSQLSVSLTQTQFTTKNIPLLHIVNCSKDNQTTRNVKTSRLPVLPVGSTGNLLVFAFLVSCSASPITHTVYKLFV